QSDVGSSAGEPRACICCVEGIGSCPCPARGKLRRAVAGSVLAESGSSLRRSPCGCEIHQLAHPTAAQSLVVRTPGLTIRRYIADEEVAWVKECVEGQSV